jgi:hypothetical protein
MTDRPSKSIVPDLVLISPGVGLLFALALEELHPEWAPVPAIIGWACAAALFVLTGRMFYRRLKGGD